MEINCLNCKHFYFETETPAYSEVTPGQSASIGCYQGVWVLDFWDDTTEIYRKKMQLARTCRHYIEYEIKDGK